ncbi:MAG: HEAT repeat domain-containing protein [Planctomycetaceae bacterium]|nr:HEAT repeat domain-containing protein [Planctomycetaceae bacterium]
MFRTLKSPLSFVAIGILFVCQTTVAQKDIITDDWPMFSNPPLVEEQLVQEISLQLIPTWVKAMEADEQELKLMAAKTIGKASELGLAGLEVTITPLIALVTDANNRALVRHTAAMSLVQLNAKQAGEVLLELVKAGDFELSAIVEPAFAEWGTAGAVEVWRTRIVEFQSKKQKSASLVRLAITGLGKIGNDADRQSLVAIAKDTEQNAVLRIAAAHSVAGTLAHPELEIAEQLTASNRVADHFIAALLASPTPNAEHRERCLAVITKLVNSKHATVQAIAFEALAKWNPAAVLSFGQQATNHFHFQVRGAYVNSLNQLITADNVVELATFLNDPHPQIRVRVREWLLTASETEELLPSVISAMQSAIVSDHWRMQEQAMHIAVALDQKQVAVDIVKLLRSRRNEVIATSGWALRRLAVTEELAPILEYCTSLKVAFESEKLNYDTMFAINEQFAHLFQMFGQMKYADSMPLMYRFIRKNGVIRYRVRASAVWAAGLIYEGDLHGDPKLEKALLERLNDDAPMPPEDNLVKRMACVSLARMGSNGEETINSLWKYHGRTKPFGTLRDGTEYALEQLIDEKFPPPDARTYSGGPWLLEPYEFKPDSE